MIFEPHMNLNLNNRVAIITGATGGIGSAIATELYTQGTTVILTARNEERLQKLCANLEKQDKTQPAPICIPMDLSTATEEEYSILAKRIYSQFNRIDILVNNAANTDMQLMARANKNFIDNVMHINFTAPYLMSRAVLPYMSKNKYGRIISITSLAGATGDRGLTAYSSSKGALNSCTKSIAIEYGHRGITANSIAPGIIETDAIKKIAPELKAALKKRVPAARFGKPSEIAHLVAFLASEYAAYINAQEIHINGGLYR